MQAILVSFHAALHQRSAVQWRCAVLTAGSSKLDLDELEVVE